MPFTLANLKILLIDDQEETREILRSLLAELGIFDVTDAANGKTGLTLIQNGYDLILCDWNMPSMSGIEFLREIRARGITIPFLMITGRSDQNSVVEAKKYGVDGYIRKPYSSVQIEAKLRIAVASRKGGPSKTV